MSERYESLGTCPKCLSNLAVIKSFKKDEHGQPLDEGGKPIPTSDLGQPLGPIVTTWTVCCPACGYEPFDPQRWPDTQGRHPYQRDLDQAAAKLRAEAKARRLGLQPA